MSKEQLIDRLRDILAIQKVVMMENNGRPDCKNCSLAEVVEELLDNDLPAESTVTRLEVIDKDGRQYVNMNCSIKLSYQDNDRTLKVFVEDIKEK